MYLGFTREYYQNLEIFSYYKEIKFSNIFYQEMNFENWDKNELKKF